MQELRIRGGGDLDAEGALHAGGEEAAEGSNDRSKEREDERMHLKRQQRHLGHIDMSLVLK